MAYNTGNPSGSSDPRDLYDSAADIDTWATSTTADTHPDRLGTVRKTWRGMENEFDADQADRDQRFNLFLANSGYQFVGDYAAGIDLTEYNQVVRDASGNLWRVSASTALPYTTTGSGLPENGAFIAIGDADLAQKLISDPSTGQGALLVRGSVIYVDTIADLQALPVGELVDGQLAHIVSTGRSGNFSWAPVDKSVDVTNDPYQGVWVAPSSDPTGASGAWQRKNAQASILHYGVSDDGTDQTALMKNIFTAMPTDARGIIYVPYNTAFRYMEVMTTIPSGIVLNDYSGVNSWYNTSDGYRTNFVGYVSQDKDVDDTAVGITSGHHPALVLNNTDTGVSESGEKRLASILWGLGFYDPDISDRVGLRNGAIEQFAKDTSGDRWRKTIRRNTPWVSRLHERWREGISKQAGDYVKSNNQLYLATTSGTTGSTQPLHTSGTQSDGGVSWQHFSSSDTTIYSIDENGNIKAGSAPGGNELLSMKKRNEDPSTSAIVKFASGGVSSDTALILAPTGSDGNELDVPVIVARSNGTFSFRTPDRISGIFDLTVTKAYIYIELQTSDIDIQGAIVKKPVYSDDGDSTPDVSNTNSLIVDFTTAGNITSLDNGIPNQEVSIIGGPETAGITLKHSSAFRLSGSLDVTLVDGDVVTMRKLPWTTAWTEVSRSIK